MRKYRNKIFFIIAAFIVLASFLYAASAGRVKMNPAEIIFDDGDSFGYHGVNIRLLGIDTPEIIHKEHGIYENQHLGLEAAEFTRKAFSEAKDVFYEPFTKDRYGRTLAHVIIDGELLAVKLIEAGLAYETISQYGDNGFKEYGDKILNAWNKVPRPTFTNPFYWRKKHQKKRE
ncbi:MAG: thermonuclease family protein [Elusimicrobiota bacterium]